MDRHLSRIEAANSLSLPSYRARLLPRCLGPIKTSSTHHLGDHRMRLESSSTIAKEDFNACFNLIASTSADAYAASSIGWSPAKKRKEMKLPDLRYLLLIRPGFGRSREVVEGFLSFMLTYEDGYEVVYCYELHLCPQLQGHGVGRYLMGLMEEVGKNAEVEKAMLTVFLENKEALLFYEKLGYSEDEYSPAPRKMRSGIVKMPTYVILSKDLHDSVTK